MDVPIPQIMKTIVDVVEIVPQEWISFVGRDESADLCAVTARHSHRQGDKPTQVAAHLISSHLSFEVCFLGLLACRRKSQGAELRSHTSTPSVTDNCAEHQSLGFDRPNSSSTSLQRACSGVRKGGE